MQESKHQEYHEQTTPLLWLRGRKIQTWRQIDSFSQGKNLNCENNFPFSWNNLWQRCKQKTLS